MISRRHFVQAAMATTALYGASGFGNWSRLAAQQVLSQDDLIGSSDFGNVSLIHITDMHAQTQPIYFREPEFNIGVGAGRGRAAAPCGRRFPRGLRDRAGQRDGLRADL
jgi:sulfur-oxidizing protein SoxB